MNTDTTAPTPETIAPDMPPTNGSPIHLARCAACDFTVRYRPLPSGVGYTFIDNLGENLGVGEHGRPTCPNGHGEMELADDRLPIEQAIEQVAAQLDAEPQRLPYPVPPFNYEGVLRAICDKRHDIAELERKAEDRKAAFKRAKDDLDEANLELGRLIDRFELDEQDRRAEIARREARASAGHPEETTLVRCTWEEAHPDEACPICHSAEDQLLAERKGCGGTARDSSLHVDAADRLIWLTDTDVILDLVQAAGIRLSAQIINAWSVEDRATVQAWAEIENGLADKPDDHHRPAILGTAHVAQDCTVSEAVPGDTYQCCRECGARLLTYKTGSDEKLELYPAGTLVGTDCPGAKEPARRIAKRGKKGTK